MSDLLRRGPRRLVIPRGSLAADDPPLTAVLALDGGRHGGRHAAAIVLAIAAHAGLAGVALASHLELDHPAPRPAPRHVDVTMEAAPPPPPAPSPSPAAPAPRQRTAAPAPHAQAGKALTRAPDAGPADMTGFDIAVGEGTGYAGGATSSSGTSRVAVVEPAAVAPRAGDASRSAAPAGGDWSCGWPEDAIDSDLRETRVTLRVHVGRDGRPAGVEVLQAPAANFADAARRCAERETYRPARDAAGQLVPAVTPPFVVHFVR